MWINYKSRKSNRFILFIGPHKTINFKLSTFLAFLNFVSIQSFRNRVKISLFNFFPQKENQLGGYCRRIIDLIGWRSSILYWIGFTCQFLLWERRKNIFLRFFAMPKSSLRKIFTCSSSLLFDGHKTKYPIFYSESFWFFCYTL